MNPLELLAERSAGGFPNLAAARQETARRLEEMRGLLSPIECDGETSVVLFGSWGRQELTSGSDDDWAVGAYDAFIGLLNDPEMRNELEGLSRSEAARSDVFKQGKRLVKDFQQGLLALLFETSLGPLVREYGIF